MYRTSFGPSTHVGKLRWIYMADFIEGICTSCMDTMTMRLANGQQCGSKSWFNKRRLGWKSGGPSRNRTGVQGFAVLCVTTPPSGLETITCVNSMPSCGEGGRLATWPIQCNRQSGTHMAHCAMSATSRGKNCYLRL